MTSKYQKTPFDLEKLLKMNAIEVSTGELIDYTELKLSIIYGQLCFVTSDNRFMPIARVNTIKDIIEKSEEEK